MVEKHRRSRRDSKRGVTKRTNGHAAKANGQGAPELLTFLEDFPTVPSELRPREMVFDALSDERIGALRKRGYAPVVLRLLPRGTPEEQATWLVRLLQGVLEGTVNMAKDRAEALGVEYKRLFGRDATGVDLSKKDNETMEKILGWGQSRHTFEGTTTMVAPEKVAAFVQDVQRHHAAKKH